MAITNPTDTLQQLRLENARLRGGMMARNTVLGYGYDVQMYAAWCRGFQRAALPTSTETLSLYLTDLLVHGKKITTARRRLAAILHEHRSHDFPSPGSHEICELLGGAQRIKHERPRQMRAVTVRELRKMSAGLARSGTAAAMRNRALLVLGFASALRRSNLAALTLADLEFCSQGVILCINREKQDKAGMGRRIAILRGCHVNSDPVRVLRAWLRIRGSAPGPLFARTCKLRRGEALGPQTICRIVKKCLLGIGIDPIQSGAHSLRSGAVTALGEANVGVLRIAAYTGQSPTTVQRYFRRTDVWRNNAGGKLGL